MNKLKPCPFCGYPAVFEPFKERKGYAATVRCCNCPAEITTITYDTEKEAEMEAVFAWNTRNIDNVVEAREITSVITRLRSNRDSNLTRYTSNEGKESHIIVSQKDRGYFQALDDIEESLRDLRCVDRKVFAHTAKGEKTMKILGKSEQLKGEKTMTFEELWEKFTSYPDRLEVFNRNTNVLDGIEETWKMEDFVVENGNMTVHYFDVNFNPSVLHVELE